MVATMAKSEAADLKIALDLDSTLAGTALVALDLINGRGHPYSYDDIQSWSWGLDVFGPETYLSGLWHAWTLRPFDIQPLEEDISEKVWQLWDFGTVDIVTAQPDHPGISDGKQEWLEWHDIPHDEFVTIPPNETKADLAYDWYIDDKPYLPEHIDEHTQTVWLYDQPYNRDAAGWYTRVQSLEEVGQ